MHHIIAGFYAQYRVERKVFVGVLPGFFEMRDNNKKIVIDDFLIHYFVEAVNFSDGVELPFQSERKIEIDGENLQSIAPDRKIAFFGDFVAATVA